MSYLSQPTSKTDYGVTLVGSNISVFDGVISLAQDLSPNANVIFNNLQANNGSFGNALFAAGNLVVTHVNPTSGAGISLSNVVSNGYTASFTVTNTGVLNLNAGTGIALSANTGNITISTTGTDFINVIGVTGNYTATTTDEYIGVNSANAVTINLPTGVSGRVYTIKDEHGQGSGKITLQPVSGEQIDNANTYIISVPFQAVTIVFRSGIWRII